MVGGNERRKAPSMKVMYFTLPALRAANSLSQSSVAWMPEDYGEMGVGVGVDADAAVDWTIVFRVLVIGADAIRLALALGGRTGGELRSELVLELRFLLLLVVLVMTPF